MDAAGFTTPFTEVVAGISALLGLLANGNLDRKSAVEGPLRRAEHFTTGDYDMLLKLRVRQNAPGGAEICHRAFGMSEYRTQD